MPTVKIKERQGWNEKQTRRDWWMQTSWGGGSGDGGNRSSLERDEWRVRRRVLQRHIAWGRPQTRIKIKGQGTRALPDKLSLIPRTNMAEVKN